MKKITFAALLFSFAVATPAYAWEPFTEVTNVCETCEQEPADVVTLTNGNTIRGSVVGENPAFYVVVRYTEARAIPRGEVKSIAWAKGNKPAAVSSSDQLLLKNGVVFSGTILENKTKPALIQLKSSFLDQTYIVFKAEIQEAYQSGTKLDISQ